MAHPEMVADKIYDRTLRRQRGRKESEGHFHSTGRIKGRFYNIIWRGRGGGLRPFLSISPSATGYGGDELLLWA